MQPQPTLNYNFDCNISNQSGTLAPIIRHTVNCTVDVYLSESRGYTYTFKVCLRITWV